VVKVYEAGTGSSLRDHRYSTPRSATSSRSARNGTAQHSGWMWCIGYNLLVGLIEEPIMMTTQPLPSRVKSFTSLISRYRFLANDRR